MFGQPAQDKPKEGEAPKSLFGSGQGLGSQPSTGLFGGTNSGGFSFGATKPASSGGLFGNKTPAENDKSKKSVATENKPFFAPTLNNSFGGTKVREGASAEKPPADA